jgi:signal transduction histidine kinase
MADPEPVDLVELVRGVAAPWADRVTIRPDAPMHTATVVEPLRLALAALVENAVQFGQRATITVVCPRPGACTVTVEDEGPGIDPAHFEDVLDPFFRLDEARARDTGGFGLGIPTAHLLMTRFAGRMTFAKSARGGLSVRLDVPPA